jgi:hypothetical protein
MMKKLLTLLISSGLGLIGCTTSATVLNVGELITKHNGGPYVIQANCVNGSTNLSNAIISDSTGGSQAFITRRCYGYGRMRVIKEGTSIRVLSFMPIKEIADINNTSEDGSRLTPQGIINNGNQVNLANNGVTYE